MSWLIRSIFVLLVAVAIFGQLKRGGPAAAPNDEAARLAAIVGPRLSGPIKATQYSHSFKVYSIPVSGCAQPIAAVPMAPDLSDVADVAEVVGPGRAYYAYFDWLSVRPDQFAVFRRRMEDRVLSGVRLRTRSATGEMLYIAEDPGCHMIAAMNWRPFWIPAKPAS